MNVCKGDDYNYGKQNYVKMKHLITAQVQFRRLQPRQKHTDSRKLLSALILT